MRSFWIFTVLSWKSLYKDHWTWYISALFSWWIGWLVFLSGSQPAKGERFVVVISPIIDSAQQIFGQIHLNPPPPLCKEPLKHASEMGGIIYSFHSCTSIIILCPEWYNLCTSIIILCPEWNSFMQEDSGHLNKTMFVPFRKVYYILCLCLSILEVLWFKKYIHIYIIGGLCGLVASAI